MYESSYPSAQVDLEFRQAQRDLNLATLKATVKMLDHLELESPEGLAEDDAVHFVSRLFIRYVYYFQRVADFSRSETVSVSVLSKSPLLIALGEERGCLRIIEHGSGLLLPLSPTSASLNYW